MIHLIQLSVGSEDSLDFWVARLRARGYEASRDRDTVRFEDYDGLAFELVPSDTGNPPLRAKHPEIPPEHAIAGVVGARAYTPRSSLEQEHNLLTQTLGFAPRGPGEYRLEGEHRHVDWAYDAAPEAAGIQGAGTVHHIAWACPDDDQVAWQRRVREAGRNVTEVLDRDYFRSIYFREPRGVLFEIATLSPGFAVDEHPEHLGEQLRLPRQHEHLRNQLDKLLTPVENPRVARRQSVGA
jgi:glyoxalase family protein